MMGEGVTHSHSPTLNLTFDTLVRVLVGCYCLIYKLHKDLPKCMFPQGEPLSPILGRACCEGNLDELRGDWNPR